MKGNNINNSHISIISPQWKRWCPSLSTNFQDYFQIHKKFKPRFFSQMLRLRKKSAILVLHLTEASCGIPGSFDWYHPIDSIHFVCVCVCVAGRLDCMKTLKLYLLLGYFFNGGLLWDVDAIKKLSDVLVLDCGRLLDQGSCNCKIRTEGEQINHWQT